jgi:restriction system protein
MALPVYNAFYGPLLRLAADGREHNFRDAVERLAQEFDLTEDDRTLLLPSGGRTLLADRVSWARVYLAKAGLLASPRRGVFTITTRGREALGSGREINHEYLKQFQEFREFIATKYRDSGGRTQAPSEVGSTVAPEAAERTPDELIAAGYQQLHSALVGELRDRVQASSPAFFERLVIDLLVAMGYGGSLDDAGRAIGRSGDEGIDGIIKEDRLGLDVIYVQAKRWQNTIGRPHIQQFAGALQGQRARKGVFITTSSFSTEARDYAARIDTRIVLIDGEELARLMIAHGVGVATAATYELKRVDSDYFVEE